MQIDGFTFVAQILNFVVLVWLLRRFLYGPIVAAMEARERGLAERQASSEATAQQARAEAAALAEQRRDLESRRAELLAQAEQEAAAQRVELLRAARVEVAEQQARWARALADERAAFLADLRGRATAGLMALARRTLAELADADLEALVVQRFVAKLAAATGEERARLRAALSESPDGLEVSSAFPLPQALREQVEVALTALLGRPLPVAFRVDASLVLGLEARAPGHKVAWSVAGHLDVLEREVAAGVADEGERLERATASSQPAGAAA